MGARRAPWPVEAEPQATGPAAARSGASNAPTLDHSESSEIELVASLLLASQRRKRESPTIELSPDTRMVWNADSILVRAERLFRSTKPKRQCGLVRLRIDHWSTSGLARAVRRITGRKQVMTGGLLSMRAAIRLRTRGTARSRRIPSARRCRWCCLRRAPDNARQGS